MKLQNRMKLTSLLFVFAILLTGMCQKVLSADSLLLYYSHVSASASIEPVQEQIPLLEFCVKHLDEQPAGIAPIRRFQSFRNFKNNGMRYLCLYVVTAPGLFLPNQSDISAVLQNLCPEPLSSVRIIQYIHHQDGKKS